MPTLCHVRRLTSLHPGCSLRSRFIPTTTAFALKQVRVHVSRQKSTLHSRDVEVTPSRKNRLSLSEAGFWSCRGTWKRAGVNTFRCLVGCTTGDFSALWTLQTYAPNLGMGTIMALSMVSGLSTSIALETALLRWGKDKLALNMAFKTAMGMSFISMLAMELAENIVDFHLTGGVIALQDARFWGAAVVSIAAGYLVPLPWNYYRLRRYGKACH